MSTITSEQVLALAPDTSSAAAGKKLAQTRHWKNLGRSAQGLWGECQGSALYQVRVDLANLGVKCSCPSRKLPCKHGLGLLLLSASDAKALPEGEPPEWMASWLAKRGAPKEGAAPKESAKSPEEAAAAAAKRAEKRQKLVTSGLESLDLWLNDLVRNGIGQLESQPNSFWESQAARMVDAQAPGVAGRLRRMAGIAGATPDWPEKLLSDMGRLALLTHAYGQIESFAPALREDVRQLVGWTIPQEEVDARGDRVSDRWTIIGQWIDDEERVSVQRTWLVGAQTRRVALVMQFSAAGQPYPEIYLPGAQFTGELRFWPGAYPLRARVADRAGEATVVSERLPGSETVEEHLLMYAQALARQPWLDRIGCVLRDVAPLRGADDRWWIMDSQGATLPLAGADHWRLLAISGGHPIDLLGEWNGEAAKLLPLGMIADDVFTPLWEAN